MTTNFKIGERDLELVVLHILKKYPNINTTQLKNLIWQYTKPEGCNLAPLVNRNDTAIDQIIRNIISHRNDSSNNIIYRGLVTYQDGLLNITKKGLDVLNNLLDNHIKNNPFM